MKWCSGHPSQTLPWRKAHKLTHITKKGHERAWSRVGLGEGREEGRITLYSSYCFFFYHKFYVVKIFGENKKKEFQSNRKIIETLIRIEKSNTIAITTYFFFLIWTYILSYTVENPYTSKHAYIHKCTEYCKSANLITSTN